MDEQLPGDGKELPSGIAPIHGAVWLGGEGQIRLKPDVAAGGR